MQKQFSKIPKILLLILGFISLGLGITGIFIPILPTTPFLLLSAACFMHSSQRFYNWLINNKYLGEYIRNYQEGNGIAIQYKIITLAVLWLSIGGSILFLFSSWWLRGFLLAVAVGVTLHMVTLPTFKNEQKSHTPNSTVKEATENTNM